MTGCEDFELAIERAAHDALDREERAALEAHLATCEPCRTYAAAASRSRRALAAIATTTAGAADWTALEARLRRSHGRRRMQRTLTLALAGPVAIAAFAWGLDRSLEGIATGVLLVAAVVGGRLALDASRSRRLARLSEREAFLDAYGRELARDIRRMAVLRWLAAAIVACFAGLAIVTPGRAGASYAMLALLVAGTWAPRLLVELPRKRRELAALGRRG